MADFVGSRGQAALSGVHTASFNPSANTRQGNTLVLAIGDGDTSTVSDSQSNPWIRGSTALATTIEYLSLWYSYQTTALTTADTITVGGPNWASGQYVLGEFTGIIQQFDTEAPIDVAATAFAASGGGWSVGPTPATTYASEIAVAAFWNKTPNNAFTVGSPYLLVDSHAAAGASSIGMEYRLLTATGAQTATCSFVTSTDEWGAVMASFITDTPQNAPPPLLG